MGYITSSDSPEAQDFEARWNNVSGLAREFAAANSGRFIGVLPHVIAEFYDDVHNLPLDKVLEKYKFLEVNNLFEINFQSKYPEMTFKEKERD